MIQRYPWKLPSEDVFPIENIWKWWFSIAMLVYRRVFGFVTNVFSVAIEKSCNPKLGYTLEVYELPPLKKGPNVVREKIIYVQSACSGATASILWGESLVSWVVAI